MSDLQPSNNQRTDRFRAYTPWQVVPAVIVSLAILLAAVVLAAATASMFSALIGATGGADGISEHLPQSWPGGGGKGDAAGALSTGELGVMLWMQALIVIFTLAAASAGRGRRSDVLSLRPAGGGARIYLMAFGGLLVGILLFNIAANFIHPDDWRRDLEQYQSLLRTDQWWLFALVVGIGAPLSEELLFRGFMLPALAQSRIGYWGGAVVTSVAWTALHWGYSLTSLIEVFLIGLYFCFVLWRTGSLWVAIICHGAYNLSLLAFLWAFGGGP